MNCNREASPFAWFCTLSVPHMKSKPVERRSTGCSSACSSTSEDLGFRSRFQRPVPGGFASHGARRSCFRPLEPGCIRDSENSRSQSLEGGQLGEKRVRSWHQTGYHSLQHPSDRPDCWPHWFFMAGFGPPLSPAGSSSSPAAGYRLSGSGPPARWGGAFSRTQA